MELYKKQKYTEAIKNDIDNIIKVMKNYYLGDIEEDDDNFFLVKEGDFDPVEMLNMVLPQTNIYPFSICTTFPLAVDGEIIDHPGEIFNFTSIVIVIKAFNQDIFMNFPVLYPLDEDNEKEEDE